MSAVNVAMTEVIARLGGGAALYDVSVSGTLGLPATQAAVTAARAALLATGGPGTVLSGPALLSQASTTKSVSSSSYSLDPSTPPTGPGVDSTAYQTVSATTFYGPGLVNAAVPLSPAQGTNPVNAGVYSRCGIQTLPSTTAPTCSAVDGGTLFVLAGQAEVTIYDTTNYLIDTATTVTNTTTLTLVYEVDGIPASLPTTVPEPAGWSVFALGLGAMGLLRRPPRRSPR